MKDNSIAPTVDRVGTFAESKFGIANSEDLVYIFDILRNKLYSDKAMAVVREYCTNAADANTENGVPETPIHITVPNRMNPVFKVRDFGSGLSEDDIRTTYCMYGRSTKRNSNAFTGQLGLGSKSGFAYGDSFTITSFRDGIKTVYSAYIDETKLGSIAKIHSQPTNEPNGIEISIPVKSADIDVFRDKISTVIRHFKVAPVVNGNIDYSNHKEVFKGSFWSVADNSKAHNWGYNGSYKNATAVMGNIGYPIDVGLVFPEIKNYWQDKLPNAYRFITGSVILNFEIGELAIAASREELEYNSLTINAIKNKADKAYKELLETINSEVSKASDGLLARILLARVKSFTSVGSWGDIENNVKWNGKKLNGSLVPCGNTSGFEVDSYTVSGQSDKVIRNQSIGTIAVSKDLIDKNLLWIMESQEDHKLYGPKMCQMARNAPGSTFYLFKIWKGTHEDGSAYDGNSWFDKNIFPKSYLKSVRSYELQKTQRAPRTTKRRAKGFIEVYTLNSKPKCWGTQADNWTPLSLESSKVEFYIPISKFKIVIRGAERSIDIIENVTRACKHFKIDLPVFYGVKTADLEKISNATSIQSHINSLLSNNARFNKNLVNVCNKNILSDSRLWKISPMLSLCINEFDVSGKISEDSPFFKMIKLVNSCQTDIDYETLSSIQTICDFCEIDKNKHAEETSKKLDSLIEDVNKKYPLIKYLANISRSEFKDAVNAVYEYINKID